MRCGMCVQHSDSHHEMMNDGDDGGDDGDGDRDHNDGDDKVPPFG